MKLYSAKVRLLGSLNNEVRKTNLTAAEIAILQRIHGGHDAVVDIVEVGKVNKRTDRSERNRLMQLYPDGPDAGNRDRRLFGEEFIGSVLGVGTLLPQEYTAPAEVPDEAETIVTEEPEEIVLHDAPVAPAKPAEIVPDELPVRTKATADVDDIL